MRKAGPFIALLIFVIQIATAQDTLRYSKKQVMDDINFLFANAADIHPNLYHALAKQQLTDKVDSLIKTLPDFLTLLQAYKAIAQATAFINEGHTGINTPRAILDQSKAGIFKSIPLQVMGYDGKRFLANLVAPDAKANAIRIIAINGRSSADILKQLTALKGGLPSFRQISVINSFSFFSRVIGLTEPYSIEYLDTDNKRKVVKVNGINTMDYQAAITKPVETQTFTFKVIDNKVIGKSIGYINFRSMDNYGKFTRFCDSVFKFLNEQHVDKLIVDLRENSGGNSQLGWYLLNYITDTPFRMAGESARKVSQQFKDHINANKKIYGNSYDGFMNMQNGTMWKIGNEDLYKPDDKTYKFKGRVCFLIGPYTFSSANMLSATIKDFKLATLIGEATGEPGNDYGELCDIKLPNTGLRAFTSTTIWVRPNNNKMDLNPIFPDYLIKQTSAVGDDVLNFAEKW
jgi:hypothetical protein